MDRTIAWLKDSLQLCTNGDNTPIIRVNRTWTPIAGFSQVGCVFGIYKDENNYCVHSGEEWKENEEPLLGYFNPQLSYNELIMEIAKKYDTIRANVIGPL